MSAGILEKIGLGKDKASKKEEPKDISKKGKQEAKAKVGSKKVEPKGEAKKEQEAKGNEGKAAKGYKVLSGVIETEKSSGDASFSKYYFKVARKAGKREIKEAVEAYYKVKVMKVNVMNMRGKKKRFGLMEGKRKDSRKAIVTLKAGQSISF